MLDPRKIKYPTRSTTMGYDNDLSLMEWDGDKEPVRGLKRKRRAGHRSRRGQGQAEQQVPPEVKTKNKRGKYLLVGSTITKGSIDQPRMAMLNRRIIKAALVIEEKFIARSEEQKLKHKYDDNITN